MKVFVYGTLLRGLSRHSALGRAVFRGHGIVGGMLTDLGDYPVLARGDGIVHGEVFEVDGSTLQSLDAIEGYRLMFNKKADGGGAYGNIAWAGAGYRCPFTACVLDRDQLRLLDGFEGAPSHYARIVVPFSVMSGGPARMGHLYMANPEKLTSRGTPSAGYLKYIYDGYTEHGFDTRGLPVLQD